MHASPYRLTALTLAGSLLSVAGLVCGSLPFVHASLPWLMLGLAGAVTGALGMYWASYLLREDVRNERWPEETLAPFRRMTDHVLWKVGMGLLFVGMLATLLQDRHHRQWFWAFFILLQMQTKVSNAFARPRKAGSAGTRLDFSQVPPLRSEHWGQRLG